MGQDTRAPSPAPYSPPASGPTRPDDPGGHEGDQRAGRVDAGLDAYGKVDILVNNAGITRDDLVMRMAIDEWKAGLIGLTKAVAREVASRNITVNAVAPGFVLTELTQDLPDALKDEITRRTPLARFGTADDVANAVAFLASDEAAYITGQVLAVDGGLMMM